VLAAVSAAVALIPIVCQQAINSQFCQVSPHWLSPVDLGTETHLNRRVNCINKMQGIQSWFLVSKKTDFMPFCFPLINMLFDMT
jgi:hypothetical protein